MAEKKVSYKQAITELEAIVKEIEDEDVEVDNLLEKVKRASFLIKYCKEKLRDTETEVQRVLTSVETETIQREREQ